MKTYYRFLTIKNLLSKLKFSVIYIDIFLTNLGIALGEILLYFADKLLNLNTLLGKFQNISKLIAFFVGVILIGGIITNQIIQPIFTPRISEIKFEPMYVQYLRDIGNNWYEVNKVTYSIEVPLFPNFKLLGKTLGKNTTILKFPNSIKINKHLKNKNPYIYVPLFEDRDSNFIDTNSIKIILHTDAWMNRNLEQIFYIYNPTDMKISGFSDPVDFQWNFQELNSGYPCNIIKTNKKLVGFGQSDSKYYRFYIQSIKSRCNLDIRLFPLEIIKENYQTICLNENKVIPNDRNEIIIDISPKEIKNILFIEDPLNQHPENAIVFNWTYSEDSICFYAWRKYQELGKS